MAKSQELHITFKIPYKELIKRNGLQTCLEIVPGTRQYLTQERAYGIGKK